MPVEVDIEKMREAAREIVGKHDFSSFRASGSCAKTSVRNILSLDIDMTEEGVIVFEIVGEGFLKYMVRIIVGTLFEIGRGRFVVDDIKKIVDAHDRRKAGPTAPARGLFLVEVGY
jgi:tRNA pseudouridine38-40 synthase